METWQRRFGGRHNVIGERVFIGHASSGDHLKVTVVGVLEPGFRFEGEPPEILRPVGISAVANRRYGGGALRVVARLAPNVTREQAEAAAAGLAAGSRSTEPLSARLVLLTDEHLGSARRPLWLLLGGAGLLLLIACSNVAGILLGEARARSHEMAVRSALGSGRPRLVRQILVEHALLAILGTALGICGAYWLIRVVVGIAPEGLPRINDVHLDARAAAFATLSGLVTLLSSASDRRSRCALPSRERSPKADAKAWSRAPSASAPSSSLSSPSPSHADCCRPLRREHPETDLAAAGICSPECRRHHHDVHGHEIR